MKKKEKSRRNEKNTVDIAEGLKKKKLQPTSKEKYRVKNKVMLDDEDEEIDLFGYENDQ
ncbi:MAG TPA: hypothetical protein PKC40_00170 [Saprospiraceae bacterium]|nr:hypothetical protein [Saprospiraceae bacterium]